MNYSIHVLELLKQFTRVPAVGNPLVSQMMIKAIQSSHKYVVPPPTTVKTKITAQNAPFIRCPFPEMLFEFAVPYATDNNELIGNMDLSLEPSTKRVALVIDLATSQCGLARLIRALSKQTTGIAVQSFYWLTRTRSWNPSVGAGVWTANDANGMHLDGVTNKLSYGVTPVFDGAFKSLMEQFTEDEVSKVLANDVHEDLCHALRMIALVNAKNIKEVLLVEPPEKLNKKRIRANKQPYFAYHTLNVFLSKPDPGWRKRMPDPEQVLAQFRGLPLHMVAGHFKQRKTGLFWWNPHTRGSEAYGKVDAEHMVVT